MTAATGRATLAAVFLATVAGAWPGGAAAARTVPRCRTADLAVTLGRASGAMGSAYWPIVFHNRAAATCSLYGYPGVSYVAGPHGAQVGPAAARDPGPRQVVLLAPGAAAHAVLREGATANYPVGKCRPVAVRGLRVYPPNTRAAVFLPWRHRVCSRGVGQAGVQAAQTGTG